MAPNPPAPSIMQEFRIGTRARLDMVDVTHHMAEAVKKSGIKDGLCTVFVPHTTAAITINENADPDVPRDIMDGTDRIIPQMAFKHGEGNSDGHIKSTLYGPSICIIVKGAPSSSVHGRAFTCASSMARGRGASSSSSSRAEISPAPGHARAFTEGFLYAPVHWNMTPSQESRPWCMYRGPRQSRPS
jgi:secondary thiamine-phosphate synthase enzyme